MDRSRLIDQLESHEDVWDLIIIGGGATGLGCAIDAASRGYSVALFEMEDFAKATSSRSTKLVHGGVRYLEQGNISLVLEALHERGLLEVNAPHLVSRLAFVIPTYKWWQAPYYGIGLRVYDLMARGYSFGRSHNIDREETLRRLPTVEPAGLRGGVVYFDGLFDDARLAINMAQTAVQQGAVALNYCRVRKLLKSQDGKVNGVEAVDRESGKEYRLEAKAVINATGIFTDEIRRMGDPEAPPTLRPSQGIHIVLDRRFLPGDSALMIPKTDDGRVLFAIPWHDHAVIGTTDTEVDGPAWEPKPFRHELEFLVEHTARYLAADPTESDVLSAFAGIRPLVTDPSKSGAATSKIARDHVLHVSKDGLVTISGGKWTTYRKMAEDTIDRAAKVAELAEKPCKTETLRLHGEGEQDELAHLGRERPDLGEKLDPRLPITGAHVVLGAREEMARTVDDVLARRTRCLILNAQASIDVAPRVAALLALALGRDEDWQGRQVAEFTQLARGYLPGG